METTDNHSEAGKEQFMREEQNREKTIWGVQAGTPKLGDRLFRSECAAVANWHGVGDLTLMPARIEVFRAFIGSCRPDLPDSTIACWARRTYEFVHEMSFSDWVVRPIHNSSKIDVAFVSGPYRYDPDLDPSHPHIRTIHWCFSIPASQLTPGARAEIKTQAEFFRIVNFREEIQAIFQTL